MTGLRSSPLLAPQLDSDSNNFGVARFLAAALVVISHSYLLAGIEEPLPMLFFFHNAYLGNYTVEAFFVMSGLLVAQSYERRRSLLRFVRARVLRLYPALICGVVLSIAVAALCNVRPLPDVVADSATWWYFWINATALQFEPVILGAFPGNVVENGPNGSLWTLPVELRMYAFVAVVGALGLLSRPPLGVPFLIVAVMALIVWRLFEINEYGPHILIAVDFVMGMLAYLRRNSLRLSFAVCAMLAIVFGGICLAGNPGFASVAFACLLPYWLLCATCHPAIPHVRLPGDYSYGTYLYAFPIQQTTAWLFPYAPIGLQIALSFTSILLLAVLSWHFVEAPALRAK